MSTYRLTEVNSLRDAPPPGNFAADIIVLPSGEGFVRQSSGDIGGWTDIFRSIGLIGGASAGAIASAIPGVSGAAASVIGTAAAAAAGLFLAPRPPGGPARGLAQINSFGAQVIAALDTLIVEAGNGQKDRATVYDQADKLVAVLSDPTAVYQAQRGDDAEALTNFKAQAAQKAQQAKAAADAFVAAGGLPVNTAVRAALGDPEANDGWDLTTIGIAAGVGLFLWWFLGD